ncbi:hypothetical protein CRG98_042212 [Punica granatum]|uniref:Uncharacterized protein n=1 Tax=Punica granatum TaxID=22663 RepID=A0A2I0I1R8_PUNGR|nr:hypothetical protein CRG98_042212 [Punica granatum]
MLFANTAAANTPPPSAKSHLLRPGSFFNEVPSLSPSFDQVAARARESRRRQLRNRKVKRGGLGRQTVAILRSQFVGGWGSVIEGGVGSGSEDEEEKGKRKNMDKEKEVNS